MKIGEAFKPTPIKVIIPLVLVVIFIAATFYGASLASKVPLCKIIKLSNDNWNAIAVNDTQAMKSLSFELNKTYSETLLPLIARPDTKAVAVIYYAAAFGNPLLNHRLNSDVVIGFFDEDTITCLNKIVESSQNNRVLAVLNIDKPEYNPYYSFKNLFVNSLFILIEVYIILCLLHLLKLLRTRLDVALFFLILIIVELIMAFLGILDIDLISIFIFLIAGIISFVWWFLINYKIEIKH